MTMISVVSPVFRSADCLRELHRRLSDTLNAMHVDYEIILVEDAGGDGSDRVIEELARSDPHVRGILFSRNFGQHAAISAGLAEVRGEWVVVLDCDLQDPPEEIPRLYEKCLEGYDVVFARRMSRSDSAFRQWTSRLWHEVLFYLSDTRADPTVGSFSVISQQVVREFLRLNDVHRHYLTLLRWLGFRQAYVDVVQAPRFAGRSSYTLRRLIRHSVIGIASQSTKLLHFSIYSGFVFVLISIAQISYLVIRKLYFGIGVEGWASLMAVLWLVGGTILFSTGVLGVYIGNIFEQTKQRPLYVVRKRVSAERSSRERQPDQPLAVAE